MMRRFITTTQLVLMASIVFSLSIASGEIIQLTDNDYDDTFPIIDNGQVVWGSDDSTDNGIFYWDGTSVQQLINSDIPSVPSYDRYDIHNGHLVWTGYNIHDPQEHHIFYWDGISYQSLDSIDSMPGGDLYSPKIHNGMVVWVYDYVATIAWGMQLSERCTVSGQLNHFNPQIHNGQVVYVYGKSTTEIYYWDETSCINLSNNSYDNKYPQIHNGQVVWQTETENGFEVFYWNGANVLQLTDNSYDDIHPQIHNDQVVWYGWDGNEFEIFLWDGTRVQQLTDNEYQDYEPMIHNGQMAWTIDDASRNSAQIVFWDGTSLEQLTYDYDTQNRYPQIHDGQVVWQGDDGTDSEIFYWDGIKEGSLIVNIEPASARSAGAKWRVGNSEWRDSGAKQDGIPVGDHFVEFSTIPNLAMPPSQTVNITFNETASISQTYTAQSGSLTVNISPAEAVSAGVKWRVYGGSWHHSGETQDNLGIGDHWVEFLEIADWKMPDFPSATIIDGQTTTINGVYTKQNSSFAVTIEPAEVVSAGAKWKVNGGPWQNSGDVITGLNDGTYTIEFQAVTGWSTPDSQSVTITDGENISTNGVYTESGNNGGDGGGGGGCFINAMVLP